MDKAPQSPSVSSDTISIIPLGGIEDVTKNMYVYEYKDEILVVDCGIGFADETMLGVELLLPDITYLLTTKKKIVGMVLTHGHEDHIGALPFLLPQLPDFPIYASPLTAALANEKLQEFKINRSVKIVQFDSPTVALGKFSATFIRVTHSVPDSANIFIKTPVGNFFHGSDFKFDLTPYDGKRSDFVRIAQANKEGILALLSDCLGAERVGHTPSEAPLTERFEAELRRCRGKFVLTTYSSNIARLNQVIEAAEQAGRKVCFVGRSLIKAKTIAQKLGYLHIKDGTEVGLDKLRKYKDNQLVLLVAGSQGQENSAMTRIADGEHKEVTITPYDVVIFSSDTIPGNELSVSALIDTLTKIGAKVMYSDVSDLFHVSGHGSAEDLKLLISLTQPKFLVPISGTYRQMIAYKALSEKMGYHKEQILLLENGQELVFTKSGVSYGRKIPIRTVYVDQTSGEEIEGYILRDRERLAKEGIIILLAEVDASNGQLISAPEIVVRGFSQVDTQLLSESLMREIQQKMPVSRGRVTNWVHIRKSIEDVANAYIFTKLHKRPLVLPVVIEV